MDHIQNNTYPGRGIVVGKDTNNNSVIVYWIMGRSVNSRNRIFVNNNYIVSTEPKDSKLVEDPSLIVYNAMRDTGNYMIVTNGSQTDTIYEQLVHGRNFIESLYSVDFEPDAPNYTPRISAVVSKHTGNVDICVISRNHTGQSDRKFYSYSDIEPGIGYCVTTYLGDGDPLPSFNLDPIRLPLQDNIQQTFWNALDKDNRISIMTRINDKVSIINQME